MADSQNIVLLSRQTRWQLELHNNNMSLAPDVASVQACTPKKPKIPTIHKHSYFVLEKSKLRREVSNARRTHSLVDTLLGLSVVYFLLLTCHFATYYTPRQDFTKTFGVGRGTWEHGLQIAKELGWVQENKSGVHLSIASKIVSKQVRNTQSTLFSRYNREVERQQITSIAKLSAKTVGRGKGKRSDDWLKQRERVNYRHMLIAGLRLCAKGDIDAISELSRHVKAGLNKITPILRKNVVGQLNEQEIYDQLKELMPDLTMTQTLQRKIRKLVAHGYSVDYLLVAIRRWSMPQTVKNVYGYACYIIETLSQERSKQEHEQQPPEGAVDFIKNKERLKEIRLSLK